MTETEGKNVYLHAREGVFYSVRKYKFRVGPFSPSMDKSRGASSRYANCTRTLLPLDGSLCNFISFIGLAYDERKHAKCIY